MVGCHSCVPATSWAGPKHTNLLMFPGFPVKKIKTNRTKEALTSAQFSHLCEKGPKVCCGACVPCDLNVASLYHFFLLFSYCPSCYI